jgi:hypothetical protein
VQEIEHRMMFVVDEDAASRLEEDLRDDIQCLRSEVSRIARVVDLIVEHIGVDYEE